jgi:hypothetical protein
MSEHFTEVSSPHWPEAVTTALWTASMTAFAPAGFAEPPDQSSQGAVRSILR